MHGKTRLSLMTLINGSSSKYYPEYDKIIETLSSETVETPITNSVVFIGSPVRLTEQIKDYNAIVGDNIASLQVNFNDQDVGFAGFNAIIF